MLEENMACLHSWIGAVVLAVLSLAPSGAAGLLRRELTTRSWDVLGFHENIVHSPMEDQIIIAVIDSGIWPESPSFSDQGLGPPPAKWKGICDPGSSSTFKCNNKIIGARGYYADDLEPGEERSPRDTDGHGTHVAATVAGVLVRNVSMDGVGLGTARGAVPRARLAIYKVCWGQCYFRSQGIKDAIKDGCDIITMSNGQGNGQFPYGLNDAAFPSFQAMKAGMFIAFSAGNNRSLGLFTVGNTYPWVTTVGNSAGSGTDYATYVTSGDGNRFEGAGLSTMDNGKTMYPLIHNAEVTNATDPIDKIYCVPENINPESVKGKIILCEDIPTNPAHWTFDQLGCAGVIVNGTKGYFIQLSEGIRRHGFGVTPPVIILVQKDFKTLYNYYQTSKSTGQPAAASIEKTISLPDSKVPRPAWSSTRGPSLMDLSILKPDISAPGVNMIAAVPGDNPDYDALTGTSMSTPFLAGVAAYIKSFHPTWSPAAIRSALMTTATPMTDPYRNQSELAFGVGQISPVQANDPGLVYDIVGELDYVKHLCVMSNFSTHMVLNVTQNSSHDCAKLQIEKGWTLNYPSFSIPVFRNEPFVSAFRRTLTNVGNSSMSNYKAIVSAPPELTVKVEPGVLAFTQVGQALSYTLTIEGKLLTTAESKPGIPDSPVLSACIVWTDGSHQVRSPIVVFEKPADMKSVVVEVFGEPFPVQQAKTSKDDVMDSLSK